MTMLRFAMAALAAALLLSGVSAARADSVTFNYNFTGSYATNPGAYTPTASPSTSVTLPTITASAGPASVSAEVVRSSNGLGVASDPPGWFNGEAWWNNSGYYVVDAAGTANNGTPEVLNLAFTSTDPALTNTVVKSVELGFNNIGPQNDIEVFLNGVSQGKYDFPGSGSGTGSLLLNIGILSGQWLSFVGLPPIGTDSNWFNVRGLVVEGQTASDAAVPEPASLVVWGFSLVAFGAYVKRRRQKLIA